MTGVSAATRRIWELETALLKIAEGDVPLGQYGELSQAMQRFAADVLDNKTRGV